MSKSKSSSAKTYLELAQSKVEIAQGHVALAQHRLDGAVVRAPIDGVILASRAEVGTRIDPNSSQLTTSLCDLADLRIMDVVIWIPEKDLARAFKGQSCLIRLEAFPQNSYRGRVLRILPV